MKSGIPWEKTAELHGNVYVERCKKCGTEYERHFRTWNKEDPKIHSTGRFCEKCPEEELIDTLVHFEEGLPKPKFDLSIKHALDTQLCICLGSSLSVKPALHIPLIAKQEGAKLVIVNLQPTPLDKLADVRVYQRTDLFMHLLMRQL